MAPLKVREIRPWQQVVLTVAGALVLVAIIVVIALAVRGNNGSDNQPLAQPGTATSEAPDVATSIPPTTSAPPPTPPPTAPAPRVVATFSGAVNKQTSLFTIDPQATSWKIHWSMSGSSNNEIELKQPPDSYKALVVNKIGPTNDESTYYTAGQYFLAVNTNANWSVTVTEFFS